MPKQLEADKHWEAHWPSLLNNVYKLHVVGTVFDAARLPIQIHYSWVHHSVFERNRSWFVTSSVDLWSGGVPAQEEIEYAN